MMVEHCGKWGSGRRSFGLLLLFGMLVWTGVGMGAGTEGEPAATTDRWGDLKLLEGFWEGDIAGKLGTGKGLRQYEFILGGKYLLLRHSSVRVPQEKSPEGDQHEELGVFSYDSERKAIVFRQFMIEGVVSRFLCTSEPGKLVCVTEAVESGPGIRSRLTLEIVNRYRFTERFEIAWPGKELELYFTNEWTRSPSLQDW